MLFLNFKVRSPIRLPYRKKVNSTQASPPELEKFATLGTYRKIMKRIEYRSARKPRTGSGGEKQSACTRWKRPRPTVGETPLNV